MDKFVNARYARFTNSNPKLRLRLSLDWDFSDSFAPLIHQKNLVHFFSVFCYRGQKLIFFAHVMRVVIDFLNSEIKLN